jgi:hypothetical protein
LDVLTGVLGRVRVGVGVGVGMRPVQMLQGVQGVVLVVLVLVAVGLRRRMVVMAGTVNFGMRLCAVLFSDE